jgi:RHS repeat-associated protein
MNRIIQCLRGVPFVIFKSKRTDQLTTETYDIDGQLIAEGEWESAGEVFSERESEEGPLKYTSQEFEVEEVLQYNRARHYDPQTGRWVCADPVAYDSGSSNLYRYVQAKPEKKV